MNQPLCPEHTIIFYTWKTAEGQITCRPSGGREERRRGNKHHLHLCNSTPVLHQLVTADELTCGSKHSFLSDTIKTWLLSTEKMDDGLTPNRVEPNKGPEEEEGNSLDWLLGKDSPEIIPAPMDTNDSISR